MAQIAMAFTLQLALVASSSYAAAVTEVLPGMTKSIITLVTWLGESPLLPPNISKPVPTKTLPEGQVAVACLEETEFSEIRYLQATLSYGKDSPFRVYANALPP